MPKLAENLRKYDFSKLLYHEQKVGGLSVTAEKISLTFLALPKGESFPEGDFFGKEIKVLMQKEIPLTEGVVEGGVLKNPPAFVEALKKLVSDPQIPSRFVVASLPVNSAQPFVYEFFSELRPDELAGAVSLQALSSLPLPEEEIYFDWEEVKTAKLDRKRILLAMGAKKALNPYLESFKAGGLAAVACETYAWSLPREINLNNEPALAVVFEPDQVVFLAYQDNVPVFQFDVPKSVLFAPSAAKKAAGLEEVCERIAGHVGKIIKFLEADAKYSFKPANILLLKNPKEDREIYAAIKNKIKNTGQELSVTIVEDFIAKLFVRGAAKRGLLERGRDVFSSLMSVGTEETYERQRLISFIDFFQKLAISLSVFFVVLLAAGLAILNIMSKAADSTLAKQSVNIPPELSAAKNAAEIFNRQTNMLLQITAASPRWGNLFVELDNLLESSLTVRNLEVSTAAPASISGTAKTRENLITFKNKLENSSVFIAPTIPLSALVGRENIDFSVKLELKDKGIIYK